MKHARFLALIPALIAGCADGNNDGSPAPSDASLAAADADAAADAGLVSWICGPCETDDGHGIEWTSLTNEVCVRDIESAKAIAVKLCTDDFASAHAGACASCDCFATEQHCTEPCVWPNGGSPVSGDCLR